MTVMARGKEFIYEILCWKQLQELNTMLLHEKYHSLKKSILVYS